MSLPDIRGSLFINGQWCDADSGGTTDVVNPATEEVLVEVASCGRAETERTIEAAHNAFRSWRLRTPYERQ